MEQFRAKLKVQNQAIALCCVFLAAFCFVTAAVEFGALDLPRPAGDSHWQSMWLGFVSGASAGILALMGFGLARNLRALRDETKLKKLYIQETDERQIQIWTAARARATQLFLMTGLLAGIVAGYFSMTVSITILAMVTAHAFLGLACKIYYSIKM